MDIRIKRIYEDPEEKDGVRVLVDRLWPRGVSKDEAELDDWMKTIAPSDDLREWFGHDPNKWDEFKRRYRKELGQREDAVEKLQGYARDGTLTLLFAAKDEVHNNAVVLREYLLERE